MPNDLSDEPNVFAGVVPQVPMGVMISGALDPPPNATCLTKRVQVFNSRGIESLPGLEWVSHKDSHIWPPRHGMVVGRLNRAKRLLTRMGGTR